MKFILPLGDFVFGDEEESFIIGGPSNLINALEFFRHQFTGAKIFDLQGVLAITGRVGGEGQEVVIIAGQGNCNTEEFMAFGEGVEVEDNFLGAVEVAVFSAM